MLAEEAVEGEGVFEATAVVTVEGSTQRSALAFHVELDAQAAAPERALHAGPAGMAGHQALLDPPQLLGASTAAEPAAMVKAAYGAHAAVWMPWQESVDGDHESPPAHKVAERGAVGAAVAFPPARAMSHEAHVGATVMLSDAAVPRK